MAKAGIVYAGTDDGLVILSDPGGLKRWRPVGHELVGQQVTALQADGPLTVTAFTPQGAFHSEDGGQSWQSVSTMPPPTPALTTALALPGTPAVQIRVDAPALTMLRSLDAGQRWHVTTTPPQAGMITTIVLAPYHMDTVWAGSSTGELLCSDDRGAIWRCITKLGAGVRSLAVVRLM